MKKNKDIDESLKFAWAYLLTHGKLTNGEWSYYGGRWEDVGNRWVDYDKVEAQMKPIRSKAVSLGIDWTKTTVPTVSSEGVFEGTFASAQGSCLATLGRLFLRNGEEYLIGSSDDDAAHLANTAREMMKGKSSIQELAELL